MKQRSLALIQKFFEPRELKLLRYFDDLELEHVIPRLLNFVSEAGKCANVIWLTAKQFKEFKAQEKGRTDQDPEQYSLRHLRVQPLKPMAESAIAERLSRFDENASMSVSAKCDGYNSDLLCPIIESKSQEVLAFVLLIKVSNAAVAAMRDNLDRDLGIISRHVGFSLKHWESRRQSYLDDLTGLFNQKFMSMALENEIFRAQREGRNISVLFMDIDFFKSINDTKGHLVGSQLLVALGRTLKKNLRRSDYAFRYGGDEYVVILPNTQAGGAKIAAERIRKIIEQTNFVINDEKVRLTLSIGLATYPDHAKTHNDIIRMADEAMYCGKNKSRNIVFVAS